MLITRKEIYFLPKYICIHGHFYQPPRENPWLETVEVQESAAPWHDWNARINAECYSRNAASRILNKQGEIIKISRNQANWKKTVKLHGFIDLQYVT